MADLNAAIKILKEGGIVIFPTDTAFGIGCRMDNEKSVKKLFAIRKRPPIQAVPVLVSSQQMAEKNSLSPLPDNVRHLMKDYWPGALTIVYYANEVLVPPSVRAGGKTVGLRMPKHDVPLTLIDAIGVPILGPSANFHGKPTPFEYNELDKELVKLVDYVIAGECFLKQASTVVDCTTDPFKIIRRGAVQL